jgi:RNA polymerase sigma-70 factor (ECF subfamily)
MDRAAASNLVQTLFESWAPFPVRYAVRMTGSPGHADDLVQETFLALYRNLREGKTVADPKAWTLGTLRNQIRKHIRYQLRHAEDLEPAEVLDLIAAEPAWPDIEAEYEDTLSLPFSVLTLREEEVLLLRLQSLKYREIAERLGIGNKTVCTLLARAIKKLQIASQCQRNGKAVAPNALY